MYPLSSMLPYGVLTDYFNNIVNKGADTELSNIQFLEREIQEWKSNPIRNEMILADNYYSGRQKILSNKREAIGEDGKTEELTNLPNNRIVDNQYKKAVDEKKNFFIAKPVTITTDDKDFGTAVKKYFNKKMHSKLNRVCRECIDKGIAYLYPYYDENGVLQWKHFRSWDVIPFFEDEERTILHSFGRLYQIEGYSGNERKVFEYFEYYTKDGISHYRLDGSTLVPDERYEKDIYPYMEVPAEGGIEKTGYNWNRIPLIYFKRNDKEEPLIRSTKSLQDAINSIISNFVNNMEEDTHNTIMVLVNYDGENLGEFRHNLAKYGAVKITTVDGVAGDVRTLQVTVNAENYKAILGILKEALVENAKSFNVKDNRLTSDANQMHIATAYHDMDLDTDDMEVEWQSALEDMMFFIKADMQNKGINVPADDEVKITFNRNMMIDETSVIQNCVVSKDIISDETIRSKHPWCINPDKERELLKAQHEEEIGYQPTNIVPNYPPKE